MDVINVLNQQELDLIGKKLGRNPTKTEIAMFSSMWSEHCSYKSSKHWFNLFDEIKNYSKVKLGLGEGAGLIDIGNDQLIGLALESHNHPSAIDPFNGAATGVGGIIRDVISQGCKPIALLDSLRFGKLDELHTQYLLDGIVRGISSYGNCVGIPNIGGDVVFDESYQFNCLVNVMCIGLVDKTDVIRSRAEDVGDYLIVFGSCTGRDGIGGVSFASETLSEHSINDRPAVQIGDPATEKTLIDIIHELITNKLIKGMQDLGGGGLTCATSEIVFAGRKGAKINISKLPLREEGMDPWEIMVSESQERMLIVVQKDKLSKVEAILKKFEIHYGIIGEVLPNDQYIVTNDSGETLAEIPVSFLVDGFIRYNNPSKESREFKDFTKKNCGINKFNKYTQFIFNSPSLGAKDFIFDQYDKHIQTRTIMECGDNAGILDIGFDKAIGAVLDTNDYQVRLNPKIGTINAVLRCMGKLYASGLEPIALVDCLNFGNPEKKDSYWQFIESIKGLAEITTKLKVPIVGGNVSFYNETETEEGNTKINPTPTIGVLGLTKNKNIIISKSIQKKGSLLFIVGSTSKEIDGSEAIRFCEDIVDGQLKNPDISQIQKNNLILASLIKREIILSASYISRGGLFATLAKALFDTPYGAKISSSDIPVLYNSKISLTELFFSENAGRYLLEVSPENKELMINLLDKKQISYGIIGKITLSKFLQIDKNNFDLHILEKQWKSAIDKFMVS
jgi:phosphoribosylformylglycinamidine synthase II